MELHYCKFIGMKCINNVPQPYGLVMGIQLMLLLLIAIF